MKHSTEAIPKKDEPTEAFASKYKNASIFLGALMLVSVVLVLLYLALKRELCNFHEKKKQQKDDEEGLYTETSTLNKELIVIIVMIIIIKIIIIKILLIKIIIMIIIIVRAIETII